MKILCFHPALAPYRVDFFNLLAEKAEVEILFLQRNLFTQSFNQEALRGRLKCKYGELLRGFDVRQRCFRFGVLKAIREFGPDVILSYEASPVTLQLCLLKKLGILKAEIWTMMDDSPIQVRSRCGMRRVIRDWTVRNVSRVIVPSQSVATTYIQVLKSKPQTRFSPIPIIHDTATIRRNATKVYEMGRKWRLEKCPAVWERLMLFVGRLAEIKNLPWIIDRVAELPETTGFVLVGDGPQEPELKRYVAERGLSDRVLFAGRKEGDELYSIMAGSDLLALASKSEPFGAVVAEGLSWGTPCLVSDNCGAVSLVEDGMNGAVFPSGNAAGFVAAFGRLPARSDSSLLPVELKDAVAALVAV